MHILNIVHFYSMDWFSKTSLFYIRILKRLYCITTSLYKFHLTENKLFGRVNCEYTEFVKFPNFSWNTRVSKLRCLNASMYF